MNFLPALLNGSEAEEVEAILFICSFDYSKVLIIVYLNKKYFEFEFIYFYICKIVKMKICS